MTDRHLVLGGTRGIGRAYAEHFARDGVGLDLVGRTESDLREARAVLLEVGAPSVELHRGDLRDAEFRRELTSSFDPEEFSGIFLGGPSPTPGELETVAAEAIGSAAETCLAYPLSIFNWLEEGDWDGMLTVLSSSATREELCGHEFFLSALLRRPMERLLDCYRSHDGIDARVWRPKVVLTSLSRRYARSLPEFEEDASPRDALRSHIEVDEVPTASQYVTRRLT